ncbi:MAG: hypothetical protein C5B51_01645 [Terriglobia bacterium]|nr:MAG: hypothetical protein C5B51_01645 [Terriglobia bacterium]
MSILVVFAVAGSLQADVVIDFEGLSDSTTLTDQYTGLTFTNAIVLSAGIGLNEFEVPPRSGTNVVSDNNGAMVIDFASPIQSFAGYFTYYEALTIQAFDEALSPLSPIVQSMYNINVGCDPGPVCLGDTGSNPNEYLSLASLGGISRIIITGDPSGGSFALDDLTYVPAAPVPEPVDVISLPVFLSALLVYRQIRIRTTNTQAKA